jgi:hypothetical protein
MDQEIIIDAIKHNTAQQSRITDKQGKEKKWTTSPDVDHSSLCDGWDVEDFERESEDPFIKTMEAGERE